MALVKCESCAGRGFYLAGLPPDTEDCVWCGGLGYSEQHDLETGTAGDEEHGK